MAYGEGFFLVDEKEAALLAAVLDGVGTDKHAADRILCDLIELGLVHTDAGPAVYQAWADSLDSQGSEFGQVELAALYLKAIEGDEDDEVLNGDFDIEDG